jgi:hypothetical protein
MELSDKPSQLTPSFVIEQYKHANLLITNSFLKSTLKNVTPQATKVDFGRLLPQFVSEEKLKAKIERILIDGARVHQPGLVDGYL